MARKFKNLATKDKKNKTGFYLSILIIVIMVGGIGGVIFYAPQSGSHDYTFNGYDFETSDNFYKTEINDKEVNFYFLPDQVQNINIDQGALSVLTSMQGSIVSINPIQNET